MHKSAFNDKVIQEIEKLDIKDPKIKVALKKILLFEMNSNGRYDPEDYDRIFDEVLSKC